MSNRTLVRALILVAATSTLAACSDVVTAPEDDAKAGDVLLVNDVTVMSAKGGKGSGKPDGGGKLTNTVHFLPGGVSSAGGDLVDGKEKVSVSLSDRLSFTTFDGNQKQQDRFEGGDVEVRKLCVDLRDVIEFDDTYVPTDEHPYPWADFVKVAFDSTGIDLEDKDATDPLCVRARVHTRSESKGVTSLDPGETATAGGKIVLQGLSEVRGSWEWRLIFDTATTENLMKNDSTAVVVPEGAVRDQVGFGLCISRDATDTWTFHNGCAEVNDNVELWRVLDGVFTMVAVIKMPFSFQVTGG